MPLASAASRTSSADRSASAAGHAATTAGSAARTATSVSTRAQRHPAPFPRAMRTTVRRPAVRAGAARKRHRASRRGRHRRFGRPPSGNGSAAAPGRMDADACMGRVTFAARRTVRPVAACGWVAPSACLHEAIRCMKQPSHPNHVHVREVKHMIAVADGHPRDLVPAHPGPGAVPPGSVPASSDAMGELDQPAQIASAVINLVRLYTGIKAKVTTGPEGDLSPLFLLVKLAHHGPRRASDLAEQMCADPSTVSRQVASLVRSGLVERRADPHDGRASILVPTELGLRAVEQHARRRGATVDAGDRGLAAAGPGRLPAPRSQVRGRGRGAPRGDHLGPDGRVDRRVDHRVDHCVDHRVDRCVDHWGVDRCVDHWGVDRRHAARRPGAWLVHHHDERFLRQCPPIPRQRLHPRRRPGPRSPTRRPAHPPGSPTTRSGRS